MPVVRAADVPPDALAGSAVRMLELRTPAGVSASIYAQRADATEPDVSSEAGAPAPDIHGAHAVFGQSTGQSVSVHWTESGIRYGVDVVSERQDPDLAVRVARAVQPSVDQTAPLAFDIVAPDGFAQVYRGPFMPGGTDGRASVDYCASTGSRCLSVNEYFGGTDLEAIRSRARVVKTTVRGHDARIGEAWTIPVASIANDRWFGADGVPTMMLAWQERPDLVVWLSLYGATERELKDHAEELIEASPAAWAAAEAQQG